VYKRQVVLSLVVSTLLAGIAWLLLGARVAASEDPEQNNIFNFVIYLLVALPFVLALIFFGMQ